MTNSHYDPNKTNSFYFVLEADTIVTENNRNAYDEETWAATWQNQQSDCVPSEDSDQPGHSPRLIRVFAVHSMGS